MYVAPDLSSEESDVRAAILELSDSLRYQVRQGNRWTASLRRMTFARNVQGSNSIEGIHASVDDVAAIAQGERPVDVDEETERALAGYQLAMTYVLQLAQDPVVVDPTLIRSLHYMATSYDLSKRPGRYRTGPVFVQREITGDILHEGADVDAVPGLMEELADTIVVTGDRLVDAAMAHLNFVLVHPFKDGNGRMARVLQSLVLAADDDVSPVFLSIEEYLGRRTQAYYDVLAQVGRGAWDPDSATPESVRPWIRFVLTAHLNQARERAARITAASDASTALSELLRAAGIDDRALDPLFDALFGATVSRGRYIASLAEAGASISPQTATRDLATLAQAGLLATSGEKRGRVYTAADPLLRLRREVGLGRAWRDVDPFA
ncbi:Fic family protein [Rathayibacter sp. PhB151]|uniref:Fic family protein n=1 Tax=Rathayibacter sp. PhB151 TaxID=2485189 RepID=UPI0010628778|nr:Fic family protein [Rathayibacter sp. PhB151]TDX77366.1 Fic family protein [Rathayibacter sp. PhB151]